MNFDEAINKVVETINFSKQEYQMCIDDAAEIERQFVTAFKEEPNYFVNLFDDLKRTASFQRGKLFDLAPDFILYLPYKFPFKVKPIFRQLKSDNYLMLKTKANHPLVSDGHVSTLLIQMKMTLFLHNTLNKVKCVVCGKDENFRVYDIFWEQAEIDTKIHGYTLHAKQALSRNDSTTDPLHIRFDFVPAPQFYFYESPLPRRIAENVVGARYWIVTCSFFTTPNVSIFGKLTPRWQMLQPEHKVTVKNLIRLFKLVSERFNNEHLLDVPIQKNEIFWRIQEKGEIYVNLSLSDMFMDMISGQTNLKKRFYDMVVPNVKESFLNYIKMLCDELKKYHKSPKERNIHDEINSIFGLTLKDNATKGGKTYPA